MGTIYAEDLAYVHHTGFASFANGAAPGVLQLLASADIDRGLVVDLGCGSGLLARALVEADFRVLGVDHSPAMIELARATAPEARFVEASLHSVELPRCVAVTALGEAFNYWSDDDPREALPDLFARVASALVPSGLLIFDAVLRATTRPLRYQTTRAGPDWRIETDVDENPRDSVLTRRIVTVRTVGGEERRSHELHRLRTFSRHELEEMLRARGFSVRVYRRYGAMALPSQRLAFRARRRGQ